MTKEKTVIKDTQPLTDIKDTPSDNGAQPEIEKAIKLVELQQDLTQMIKGLDTLQKQVVAQMGAIQYAQQLIDKLSKVEVEKE